MVYKTEKLLYIKFTVTLVAENMNIIFFFLFESENQYVEHLFSLFFV